MGVGAGEDDGRLGVPPVDDLGGTGKSVVGIVGRRYRGDSREETLDELGVGSGGGFPHAYQGALLSEEVGVVGCCWRGGAAAAPVGNGQHVGR